MSDPEPPKRTVQMYDRPASADRPPLGRIVLMIAVLLIVAIIVAKFIFHIHFGHLLHAG